jgi:hypothetical protein
MVVVWKISAYWKQIGREAVTHLMRMKMVRRLDVRGEA